MKMLTFSFAAVLPLVESALNATSRNATFGQMLSGAYRFDGKDLSDLGEAKSADVDGTKIPPALHLVGDAGVYVMANAAGQKMERPASNPAAPARVPVVYANECNPDIHEFDEWWEVKNATFGEDDGVELIPLSTEFMAQLEVMKKDDAPIDKKVFFVRMSRSQFSFGFSLKK